MPNISRLIEAFLQPIGLLWFIHLIAALHFTRQRKWRRAAFFWIIAGFMSLIGSTSISSRLLASLERPYSARPLDAIPPGDAVVMLGGAVRASRHDPFGFEFGEGADRVLTAVEMIRRGKSQTLILGGGGGKRNEPVDEPWQEGPLLEGWLSAWGVGQAQVVRLKLSANTHEEALLVSELAKERQWKRIILVTSGYHMKRAEALFRKLGVPVVPVACDFLGLGALESKRPINPFPGADGFRQLELYLHEKIGWAYYRLRGWIDGGGAP
jgi:uncharacterized SAM-binding protein YcdF (DUF218 family)